MKKFVMSLLMMFLLAACSGGSSTSFQGQWKLVSYGTPSSQMPAVNDVDTSIEFTSEGRMNGNVGCNSFGGDYKVDGDSITLGPIMSTMMFCKNTADQESGTLTVLKDKATFVLKGNAMTFTSTDGKSVIMLERE